MYQPGHLCTRSELENKMKIFAASKYFFRFVLLDELAILFKRVRCYSKTKDFPPSSIYSPNFSSLSRYIPRWIATRYIPIFNDQNIKCFFLLKSVNRIN